MRSRFLSFFFIVALIANNYSAFGVSAYPYPVEIIQPDGTRISILMKGDENLKWAQTADGYSIMKNNRGIYEYSSRANNTDMEPSGIQARNERDRTSSDVQFLSKTPKGLTFSVSQVGMTKSISQMVQINKLKSGSISGTKKFLCILIGFTDKAFTKTKSDFQNLFNQVGYSTDGATGSVYDYYKENSYNQLNLSVTVAGPFTAAHNMAYYGANDCNGKDVNSSELVTEAIKLADPSFNYAEFDNDHDGMVDGILIIHAGYGEEASAPANNIWSHNSSIPSFLMDGQIVSNYTCTAELRGADGAGISRIGVLCHELGHLLGASDFYDTNFTTNGTSAGTGYWDIMGNGSWNNNGATPAHHNPYTKIFAFGWAIPKTIIPGTKVTMTDAEKNGNSFYIIQTSTPNEVFLCENRQKQGFDSYIPGHGMVIYHVDGNYIISATGEINAGSHQGMYPVCASNSGLPPVSYGQINSSGLPFPGSGNKTSFSDTTIPSSLSWASEFSYCPITDITENSTNKTISFSAPLLPGRPDVPSANPASGILAAGFSATWKPSANSTGYRIDVSTNAEFSTFVPGLKNKDVGNKTNLCIALLNSSTEYYYRIRAYNTGGISDNSNAVSLKTLSSLMAAPTKLKAVSCSNLVTLNWTRNSDPLFLRYRIYCGTTNNPTTRIDSTWTDRNDTVKIIAGLSPGLTYYFRVAAVKDDGSEIAVSNQAATIVKIGLIPVIQKKSGNELVVANQEDSIASYRWYKGNAVIINGTNPNCTSNKLPGAYTVFTIDRDGCLNSSKAFSTIDLKHLSVYPNPASVSFTMKINSEVQEDGIVSIVNSSGTKVMEFRTDQANNKSFRDIPVDNLKAGIYVVQAVLNQNEYYSAKMVVVR